MIFSRILACGAIAALACSTLTAATAQNRSPDVRLAPQLVADASAFETFMNKAASIRSDFGGAKEVSEAVKVGASHTPVQLESGMITFAALAALQEPGFVAGVERAAQMEGREALMRRLTDRPDLALDLPGADDAADRAAAALSARAEPLTADGRRVKQAAYDVQHSAWSKTRVADAAGRLARAKQLSAVSFSPSNDDRSRLFHAVSTVPLGSGGGGPTPVVQRSLALAAVTLLGGAEDAGSLQPLLSEQRSASCLRMAKLNLFQCLAVAGPHYEDIFCLGQHAMIDPGQCVADAAGARPVEFDIRAPLSAGRPGAR